MVAPSLLNTFERLANGDADLHGAENTRHISMHVQWMLDDFGRVLECEDQVGSTHFESAALVDEANASLYSLYQNWASEVVLVLAAARKAVGSGQMVDGLDDLESAFGRVSARLQLTPAMIRKALADVEQGKGSPMAESRTELHTRLRP